MSAASWEEFECVSAAPRIDLSYRFLLEINLPDKLTPSPQPRKPLDPMEDDATMKGPASCVSSLVLSVHQRSPRKHKLALSSFLLALLFTLPLGAECRLKVRHLPLASALQPPHESTSRSFGLSRCLTPSSPQPLSLSSQDRRTQLASSARPFYVAFKGDKDSLDPRTVLSLEDERQEEPPQTNDDDVTKRIRVFSFWQRPWLRRSSASEAPAGASAQSPDRGEPVVLHFPSLPGGWAQQSDGDAAERAATAGAAATCGDLLLFSLPLEALNAPASLLPMRQPLPLLMAALQLQLQLRSLKQQEDSASGALAASIAAAASRTKPLVVLLRDPASGRLLKSESRMQEASELLKDEDDLRATAAHTALRVLEEYWEDLAAELGVTAHGERQMSQPQMQQTELQASQQVQQQSLVPPLRALFSVHVVFVRSALEVPADSSKTEGEVRPFKGCTGALQRVLQSLLAEHWEREIQETSGPSSNKHGEEQQQQEQQQQQQEPVKGTQSFPDGSLWLLESAAAACKALLAAPVSSQPQLTADAGRTQPAEGNELGPDDAAAFDAEVYRRRALTRARLMEAAGPEEGHAVLQKVLQELDQSLSEDSKTSISDEGKPAAAVALTAEARQAVEDEAFEALRALHRLQLDALRAMTVRRFELFLQQLLSGQVDEQGPEETTQQANIYVLANRISGVIRQTADNFQRLVKDYHRTLDPKALRGLLLVPDAQEKQTHATSTSVKDLAAAAEAAAAEERQQLLKALRELAASILQEHQLMLVQQQIQRGFGPLQRLRQNVQHRLLATHAGGAALRGWQRLGSAATLAKGYLRELPLVRELVQSPLGTLWSNRKPIDVSFHYLSPKAFGLANVKNTATLHQPWNGQLHVQHLTSDANESQQSEETM
ncbi:hypothetical protein Emed_001499 [Eimeria media]